MSSRGLTLALAALSAGMLLAPMGWGQKRGGAAARSSRVSKGQETGKAGKTPIDEFETMSPPQQQQALQRLAPAQRQKLQQRLEKFNQLPAEQQRTLKNLYNRLHQLPADRQNAVRKAIDRFSSQPPGRQQAIRDELRGLAAMPEQERAARLSSPEFRGNFNGQERDIVRDMSALLPPR